MENDLSKLVVIMGGDSTESSKVREAVQWIASKPEGMAMLQKAFALHHAPITIIIDPAFVHLGYGANYEHLILVNPSVIDRHVYRGQNGEIVQGSLERFFSHEFTHAAQPGALSLYDFQAALSETMMATLFETVPLEQYGHRFKAAKGNDALLRNVLEDIYDTHITPNGPQMMEALNQRLSSDPRFQTYAAQYEVPAIAFENLMMSYKDEPERSSDYLKSFIYDELLNDKSVQAISREGFIISALSAIKEALQQSGQQNDHQANDRSGGRVQS